MKLYQKQDLKDSRIFFDKQPPKYLTVFILFTAVILTGAFIASAFISKSYVIKAQGIADTTDNHYVSVNVNGEVNQIVKKENDYVKKDDILFVIGNGRDSDSQEALNQPQINDVQEKIAALDLYINSLNSGVNYLHNSGAQQAYYGKMEYYLTAIKNENYNKGITQQQLSDAQIQLTQMNTEKQALEQQLETADENTKTELKDEISSKTEEISSQKTKIKQLQQQINAPSSEAAQVYQQLLSEAGADKLTAQEQLAQLKGQQNATAIEEGTKVVKANHDGFIHYLTPIKIGVAVQVNQTVAEISKDENKEMIITANILPTDISKVKVGQTVIVEILGVNTQKYGTLTGKMKSITNGTVLQHTQQEDIPFYQCKIALNKTTLTASNGDKIKLKKSMPVEARVIYKKETYFDWMKELLSFKS